MPSALVLALTVSLVGVAAPVGSAHPVIAVAPRRSWRYCSVRTLRCPSPTRTRSGSSSWTPGARSPVSGPRCRCSGTRPAGGARWLRVLLPGRPNGHTGWIAKHATTYATTSWHIVVNTSKRRVTVYKNGRPVRTFNAVVGKPSTPTPLGAFFVEEAIQLRPGDVGAPFALALSARSNVFQEFDGGPGQIALHGLMNVGGVLGTAASHGCMRLANDTMRWLVVRIGPGVPVTIRS